MIDKATASSGKGQQDQSNENIPGHITFISKFIDVSVDSVTGSFFRTFCALAGIDETKPIFNLDESKASWQDETLQRLIFRADCCVKRIIDIPSYGKITLQKTVTSDVFVLGHCIRSSKGVAGDSDV